MRVPISAQVSGSDPGMIQVGREVFKGKAVTIEPLSNPSFLNLTAGNEYRFWLLINGEGREPGTYDGEVRLTIEDRSVTVPVRVTIWDVRVPEIRPFQFFGYGTIGELAGGSDVTPESLRRLDALFSAYRRIGGTVLDFTLSWWTILQKAKLADTKEPLMTYVKRKPAPLSSESLPELDLSSFDPWLQKAKDYGILRVQTWLPFWEDQQWQVRFLTLISKKGAIPPEREETEKERVTQWVLCQLRRYFEGHQFTGFFCKISDEIRPEDIPRYIRVARVARQAGWRPFTTITGLTAVTSESVNALNPYCDQWQVNRLVKDLFTQLLTEPFRLEWKEAPLAGRWRPYTNGDAQATYALPVFGSLVPEKREEVDRIIVLEDGNPLALRGESPVSNREKGVYFPFSPNLYLSPTDGTNPNEGKHRYLLRYSVKVPDSSSRPLCAIDGDDEVWFYGGGAVRQPYLLPYEGAIVLPLLAVLERVDGYAFWGFQVARQDACILWYDTPSGSLQFGPTYLGLRDGYHDARLLHWVLRNLKLIPQEAVASDRKDALLRIGWATDWHPRHRTLVNVRSPVEINRLRKELLSAIRTSLSKG